MAEGSGHGRDFGDGPLLAGVRVVDSTDGKGESCARFLADLGADVLRIEPVGGSRSRAVAPFVAGVSATYAVRNAGKRLVTLELDTDSGRTAFADAVAGADIWIDSRSGPELAGLGLHPIGVRQRWPHLVRVAITDFGDSGPYRDWVATDWVLLALSGMLSRSGVPGRPPFMPPGNLAEESTSIQAAWVALLAYWQRLQTGVGDILDFSRHDATAQILDPAFGAIGTAAAQTLVPIFNRDRPVSLLYPIFACLDGHVRLVILAARQWRGMWEWLGRPAEFADPALGHARERFQVADRLYPLMAAFFAEQTVAEVVSEGQLRGVPVAPVLAPSAVLDSPHFTERQSFLDVDLPEGRARMPSGHLIIDGRRAGPRAAALGADEPGPAPTWSGPIETTQSAPASPRTDGPLSGLRVLDLGVIVMGGEAGRLLADQGADLIKVENRRFPDGARMTGMTSRFAAAHRNKRSLGIDLRAPRGLALFEALIATSDVLLSNFKPGTLESLGIGVARLRELNPRLVVVTSSAMGEFGPWRDWMGYGPLVRCVSGQTYLWRDPELADGFGDATTIYPDHLISRVVVTAALAALIRRRHSHRGAHIESAQAESIIVGLSAQYLRESVEPGTSWPSTSGEIDAPWGVYPCAGDDEWCVITVRDGQDWAALVEAAELPDWTGDPILTTREGRLQARARIDEALGTWTARRTPDAVAERLQAAGIPAAPMRRVEELLDDPQLRAREFFARFQHPGVAGEVVAERGPVRSLNLPDPPVRPAPYYGQHTREVGEQILGMTPEEVDELMAAGVLDGPSEEDSQVLGAKQAQPRAGC